METVGSVYTVHALLSVVMMATLAMVGFLPCEKDF